MEFEVKMASVYPIKAKIIGYGSPKSIKTLNRRLHWGKREIVHQHDPRHVDMLVKDSKVVERRRDDAGSTHPESRRSLQRAAQKQNCMQQHWERRKRRGFRA